MQLNKLHLQQRGDTIVEVLIAIAVASMVMGSAYAVINKTTKNSMQAQEHTEALKFVQEQAERLQARKGTSDCAFNQGGSQFFLTGSGANACMPGAASAGTDGRYQVGIIPRANDVYEIKAVWDGINGYQENVEVLYKVFP